jgi:ATP-dependent helicase/nuclease subunit B
MDKCTVLANSADLIREVAGLLERVGNDYSKSLVVFPGKRPAHFLRRLIAEQIGSAYIPPTIFSMEEFIDHMYEKMNEPVLRKIDAIDAIAFLFDLHRNTDDPLGGEGFLSLDAFFRLGLGIFRDLEELVIEHVDRQRLESLETFIETPVPPQTGRSLQTLSFFYDAFYPAIHRAGFCSRSERYVAVSSRITTENTPWKRIVFAGFYGLTACERIFFKKALGWDGAFLLFQDGPGMGEQLSFLGVEHRNEGAIDINSRNECPKIHFHKSADSHGQVFALSALLRKQFEMVGQAATCAVDTGSFKWAGQPNDTVIVLPAPESLFAVLYHALPVLPREDYNVSLGYPLERTPTWGFLSSLMQLVSSMDGERFYIPDYLDFVLHPYTKNVYLKGESDVTRIMFHGIEEILLQERTRSFVSLDEIEERADLLALLTDRVTGLDYVPTGEEIKKHLRTVHDELIRKVVSFEGIGDFADRIMGVLTFIYDHSSARLHPFFYPFAESFLEQLDLLKKSRVRHLAFGEKRGYFHFLKRYMAQCFTPFEGTPIRGIQVLGLLETRNLRFSRTYILDVNEGIIPDTRKEESLIPLKVRLAIGLQTYRDRDMLSAYYFDALVRGSKEVHIFFVENARKEKSRFAERLLWERQVEENAESSEQYISSLGYRLSLENSEPAIISKTTAVADFLRSRSFDATSLDVYLKCPLQFYYRYVLNMVRKDETRMVVEKVDVGRLVHKILFRYFDKRKGFSLEGKDIDLVEMRILVDSAFEEVYGPEPIGAVYLLREQITRQMEAYLGRYELPLVSNQQVTILHLEHHIECAIGDFRFKGILDRVDMRGEGVWIIDYKTGGSARSLSIDFDLLDPEDRSSWREAIGSLQLPFYRLLWDGMGGLGVERGGAMFLLLGKAHIDQGIELPLFKKEGDHRSLYERAKSVILSLTKEIADIQVPFDPALKKKDACDFCDFQYLCGTQ